jgi:hypothetical protein
MKLRFASLAILASAAVLPLAAHAAGNDAAPRPMFTTLPNNHAQVPAPPKGSKNITQWNGTFKDLNGNTINYTMIGTDPNSTNTTSHIKTIIIPIKMVYDATDGNMTFDPLTHMVAGQKKTNVIQSIQKSPLFDNGIDWVQGGTDLGQTQYIDAYQRGNFWSTVKNAPNYHVLLDATVAPEQTINVTIAQGGQVVTNPFGKSKVGEMSINAFDNVLQTFLANKKLKIKPGTFPLFITYNIYLTEGGCCIGGYHSANGAQPTGQTYGYSTFVDDPGSFSQDVSAVAHEIGEWLDDPFTDNFVHCNDNSLMENGDPLEGGPNYGGMPVKLNGYTYNPQELVFIDYFGAPTKGPANGWLSFANTKKSVCPGQ